MTIDPSVYARKRRRAVLFFIVGVWGVYQFSVRDNFNPYWTLLATALMIVSAYNFNIASQKLRKLNSKFNEE